MIINAYTEDDEDLYSLFYNISGYDENLDYVLREISEITFTIKRGKGNKEQIITIVMPVEFNTDELKLIEAEVEKNWNEEYPDRLYRYEQNWEYVREEKGYRY